MYTYVIRFFTTHLKYSTYIHIRIQHYLYQIIIRRVRQITQTTQDSHQCNASHPSVVGLSSTTTSPSAAISQSHCLSGLSWAGREAGRQGGMLSKSFSYPEQAKQQRPCLAHTVVLTGIPHAHAHAHAPLLMLLPPLAPYSFPAPSCLCRSHLTHLINYYPKLPNSSCRS